MYNPTPTQRAAEYQRVCGFSLKEKATATSILAQITTEIEEPYMFEVIAKETERRTEKSELRAWAQVLRHHGYKVEALIAHTKANQ